MKGNFRVSAALALLAMLLYPSAAAGASQKAWQCEGTAGRSWKRGVTTQSLHVELRSRNPRDGFDVAVITGDHPVVHLVGQARTEPGWPDQNEPWQAALRPEPRDVLGQVRKDMELHLVLNPARSLMMPATLTWSTGEVFWEGACRLVPADHALQGGG
ncbi:hypothetical protein QE400_000071 [Xanthomonas sacchari]|uniref:hypothetical protein n=1 Tax=Xanthomonas sacchari TaxID=56458 RepID=UPI00278196FD|nr:hypothetical protein [Xanthomonas sacchari]MDQ1090658.1 hypothetical protein [Xanthomonas sacchari]